MTDSTIYTIGHSNHTAEKFVELLKQHGIELVVDVRSSPYSRYSPQFNKEELSLFLSENGIEYAFHGNSLGGRPNDKSCYQGEVVDYALVREKDWFRDGLDYVCWEATNRKLALLCAEEDPNECHRHNLVTQELLKKGAQVIHIRGDGSLEEATKTRNDCACQAPSEVPRVECFDGMDSGISHERMRNRAMGEIADEIIDFHTRREVDPHHRFKSWEHCCGFFQRHKRAKLSDVNREACLSLAFYLASWGMYRLHSGELMDILGMPSRPLLPTRYHYQEAIRL